MIPTVGSVFDMINAAWYFSEGNYGEAALSFFGALPGIGDMAVAGVKGLGFCTKGAKIFRLAAKIIGNAGNIVLSVPKVTDAIIQLWDKHVFKGQVWDDKSLSLAIEGVTFGITAILSAKNLGETFGNIRGELTDIVTSQCFVAGTLVLTEDGEKPIEEIRPGDRVFSSNPETGESGYKEVVQTFENETEELVHVYVNGDEIVSTPNHPFYVPQKGWTRAVDLRAGDILVLSNGDYVVVEQVQHEILEAPVKVYNFEVQDFHTYYVGKNSVLVHNECKNVQGSGHGSEHHKETINNKINDMAQNGFIDSNGKIQDYDAIYGNRALSTAGLNGSKKPDIIAVRHDGEVTIYDIYEYASPSQYTGSAQYTNLVDKINYMKDLNPDTSNTRFNYILFDWGSY